MRRCAIVVFPQGDSLAGVEQLRQRFDPLAQLMAAHVTLVFPFVDELSSSQLHAHIRQAVAQTPPFAARFEGVSEADGEFLLLSATSGRDELMELHERLYRGPLAIHRRGFRYDPHITLGRVRDEAGRADALALARAQLPPIESWIREVALFRLESGSSGEVEFVVPLQGG